MRNDMLSDAIVHRRQALGDVVDDYKPDDDEFSDDELSKNLEKYQFGGFKKSNEENDGISDTEDNAPK